MKITLLKSSKLGKPLEVVEVSQLDGGTLIASGAARHPTIGELEVDTSKSVGQIRKEMGLPSLEDLGAQWAKGEAADKAHAEALKAKGSTIHDHGISKAEVARRTRAAAKLATV